MLPDFSPREFLRNLVLLGERNHHDLGRAAQQGNGVGNRTGSRSAPVPAYQRVPKGRRSRMYVRNDNDGTSTLEQSRLNKVIVFRRHSFGLLDYRQVEMPAYPRE